MSTEFTPDWTQARIYESRELSIPVTGAAPMLWDGRTVTADKVEVGFGRYDLDPAWRIAYLRISGAATRAHEGGRGSFALRVERQLVTGARDDWPAWLREFVEHITPTDAPSAAGRAAA